MVPFIRVGSLAANGTGYFNPTNVISIIFNSNTTVLVTLSTTNTGADIVTITMSTSDTDYVTHRVIADAIISAAQSSSKGVFALPEQIGNRTLTVAIA